jgi:nucleotide-binding universal stress UspA family protein
MFNRILCPTDLSESSLISIEKGAQLAQMCQAELILLNVRPEFMTKEEMVMSRVSVYGIHQQEKDIALAAKEIMKEELRRCGAITVPHKLILREGEPHKEILETAEELECDLIVLTTTGRNHLIEHIKGSDAEQILARTHVPMLVLPVVKPEKSE